ncbi:MAG: YeeE/YedE family protein [Gammaproteobacteria bacterium]|nr:YeeE/YedE family protein [Gammaproteobacteria bacterium]|tara:strand:- start:40 stop:1239 length:1200 start_codon:yes stop_codon:yes gene_type:complete
MEISGLLLSYIAILGFILGFVVSKTNFCTMGAVSDWVNIGDLSRFKSWMFAAAIAILGVTVFEFLSYFDLNNSRIPYRNSVFSWPRYVLGGLMFGVGMTYASGCGNKVLIRIGGGNLKSIVVLLIAGLMAYIMTRTDFYGIIFHSWMNPISPDLAILGIEDQSLSTIMSSIIFTANTVYYKLTIGLLVGFIFMYYIFRSGSFVKNIDNVIGGFIVGSVVVLAWYLTGSTLGQEWIETNDFLDSPLPGVGVQSFTFINPMGESIIYFSKSADIYYLTFGVTALLSVILGSFVYSMMSRSFRMEWFQSKEDFKRHMIGAVLIGIGGVLSMGCTIGQGVSGVSTLAIGSFITLTSIVIGSAIAMKIEYYNAVYEDCSFFDSLRSSLADLNLIPNKFRALEKI